MTFHTTRYHLRLVLSLVLELARESQLLMGIRCIHKDHIYFGKDLPCTSDQYTTASRRERLLLHQTVSLFGAKVGSIVGVSVPTINGHPLHPQGPHIFCEGFSLYFSSIHDCNPSSFPAVFLHQTLTVGLKVGNPLSSRSGQPLQPHGPHMFCDESSLYFCSIHD